MPHVVDRRRATALVQAGSQIPAAGMFGHLVQAETLPGSWAIAMTDIVTSAADEDSLATGSTMLRVRRIWGG